MSRNRANNLGVAAVAILVVLIVNDVQSLFHSASAFPTVVTSLMIVAIAVLANAYITYRIVRGMPLPPSFSEERLRAMMEESARKVLREEIETVAGQLVVREMKNFGQPDVPQQRPAPKPHLVRTNEN